MATAVQIDNAFRMAGISVGRPTTARLELLRKRNVLPGDSESLVNLFTDDQIQDWQIQLGETEAEVADNTATIIPGWQPFLAAYILEFLANTGVTTEGRGFDVTSVDSETFSRDFLDSDTIYRNYAKRVNELRGAARRLGGNIPTTRSNIPGAPLDPRVTPAPQVPQTPRAIQDPPTQN